MGAVQLEVRRRAPAAADRAADLQRSITRIMTCFAHAAAFWCDLLLMIRALLATAGVGGEQSALACHAEHGYKDWLKTDLDGNINADDMGYVPAMPVRVLRQQQRLRSSGCQKDAHRAARRKGLSSPMADECARQHHPPDNRLVRYSTTCELRCCCSWESVRPAVALLSGAGRVAVLGVGRSERKGS